MRMTIRIKTHERNGKWIARLSRTDGGKPQLFMFDTKAELEAALQRAMTAVTDLVLAGTVKSMRIRAGEV